MYVYVSINYAHSSDISPDFCLDVPMLYIYIFIKKVHVYIFMEKRYISIYSQKTKIDRARSSGLKPRRILP